MCELHVEWSTNEIALYVEPEVQPIAVEEPVVKPDQPITVEKLWEMNDEDDGADCEEVAPVMCEHTRGSNNILSLATSVVKQNDVSKEPVEGNVDGSIGRAIDDNVGGGQPVGCEEVRVNCSVGKNVDVNATCG